MQIIWLDLYLELPVDVAFLKVVACNHNLTLVEETTELHFIDSEGRSLFYFDWPSLNVEPEDVPIADTVNFKTLVTLTSSDRYLDKAIQFGCDVASQQQGLLYAPLTNELLFPRNKVFSFRKDNKQEICLLTLKWFAIGSLNASQVRKMISILQDEASFCLPRRFGGAPPFQGNYERDGLEGFIKTCTRQQELSDGFLMWTADKPCIEGKLCLPTPNKLSRILSNERPLSTFTLELNCLEAIKNGQLETLIDLVPKIADALSAIYAGGLVNSPVLYTQNGLMEQKWGFGSESYWSGIPDARTWISWFGPDLRERVAPYIKHIDHQSVLQLGSRPKTPDELVTVFPQIPDHLYNLDGNFSRFFRQKK